MIIICYCFWVYGWNFTEWPITWNLFGNTSLWHCLLCCTLWPILTFGLWKIHFIHCMTNQMKPQWEVLKIVFMIWNFCFWSLYITIKKHNFIIIIIISSSSSNRSSISRVVIKSRGRGFSPATTRVAPGYFYWKIEEK